MRKAIWGGAAVLLILIAWIWSNSVSTQRAEAEILAASAPIAESAVHSIDITAEGRDVTVTGIADSAEERERLIAALTDIDTIDEIDDSGLTVLPAADPYSFAVTRKAGRMIMQGNVPTEDMRAALTEAGVEGGDGLTLASGAPERWETVAGTAVAALSQMDEGSLALEGTKLRVTGLVQTPDDRDAILAALAVPEDYALTADIETVELDTTLDLTVAYSADSGVTLSGLAPSGITAAQVKPWLGVTSVTGEVETTEGGSDIETLLKTIRPTLARVETLTLTLKDEARSAEGTALPGTDPALVGAELQTALGAGAAVTITALQSLPPEGTTRTNAATGERERFTAGVWMPDRPFSPSLAACNSRANELLSRVPVSFVPGRAQLDAQGQRAIAIIADLVRRCTREAGLSAQIQGHTDNRGNNNYQLSADRAVVVQQALISQGIAPGRLSAVGFGASKPIADNGTEAGRAANRRITIAFGN